MMSRIRWIFLFVALWALASITGCQMDNLAVVVRTNPPEVGIATLEPLTGSPTPVTPTATQTPDEHLVKPTHSPQPTKTHGAPTKTPEITVEESCVQLYYEDFAQVELISSQDVRVLVDIYDPEKLSRPPTDQDALLTTHTHFDHINDAFLASFPGQQLFVRAGILSLPGVTITGISSAHNSGDRLKPEGGTNYIYLVEMDGLRIAHFGDIGQDALTQEQLDLLGDVDIAITQFANPYSDMNIQNRKGFNLMEQVQPIFIIPTHFNLETATAAKEQWTRMEPIQVMYTDQPFVTICPGELPVETQRNSNSERNGNSVMLLMGENARQFAERLGLAKYNPGP